MTDNRWKTVKQLYQQGLEVPVTERATFIESQCTDPDIRQEVLRLYEHDSQADDFLETPAPPQSILSPNLADPWLDRTVGDFLIRKRIGSGGMGTVYEAWQQHPGRRVAIKVLNVGEDHQQEQLRRFADEAEILGQLDHPGIVTIFRASTVEQDGATRPWFAMELIDGRPLNAIATDTASDAAKIRLVIDICRAIDHAHRRHIVHRDLKPANILITGRASEHDNRIGQPRIVDFGIAAFTLSQQERSRRTAVGDIIGTIRYISPEQLSEPNRPPDCRVDIYALGVILFELLTGRFPYAVSNETVAELIRIKQQEEPIRLGSVDRRFRGDLEAIVDQALATEPDRRYASAGEMADDLQRFLDHLPVHARRSTVVHRTWKYIRRNAILVAGATTTCIAMAAGMMLYGIEAKKANREAERGRYEAEKQTAVNSFISNDFVMNLLQAAHDSSSDRRIPVAALIDSASENIEPQFHDRPAICAAVHNEVATLYYNIGATDKAREHFEQALKLWNETFGPLHSDTLKVQNNLGLCAMRTGQWPLALKQLSTALDGRQRLLGSEHPLTLETMNNLAQVHSALGDLQEAERILRNIVAIQKSRPGRDERQTLTYLANLGSLLVRKGQPEKGLEMHAEAFSLSKDILGDQNLTTLIAGSRYGQTLWKCDRHTESLKVMLPVLDGFLAVRGEAHPDTVIARRLLSRIERDLGNSEAARDHLRQSIEAFRNADEPDLQLLQRLERDLERLTNE